MIPSRASKQKSFGDRGCQIGSGCVLKFEISYGTVVGSNSTVLNVGSVDTC